LRKTRQTHMNLSGDHRRRLKAIMALCLERDLDNSTRACEYAIDVCFNYLQTRVYTPEELEDFKRRPANGQTC
jgi:hypothetical protein